MTQFSILYPGDVPSSTAGTTMQMYECLGLLTGSNAHKKSYIGTFPATIWVKSNTYPRLFLLHSQ